MGYHLVYFYKLKPGRMDKFFEILRQTGEKYQEYGGEPEEIFKLESAAKDYGLNSIGGLLNPEEEEEIWLGIVKFKSESHAKEVMSQFDKDPKVNELYHEFINDVIPLRNITYGEFRDY